MRLPFCRQTITELSRRIPGTQQMHGRQSSADDMLRPATVGGLGLPVPCWSFDERIRNAVSARCRLTLLFFFHSVHKIPGVDEGNDHTYFAEWCSRRALIKRQVQSETDIDTLETGGNHESTIEQRKIDRSSITPSTRGKFRETLTGMPIAAQILEKKVKLRNAAR